MKWQEFYFKWLENIGYFQWWNATLVGHKTTEPVGGRNNTGTVCFGGEGGIEGGTRRDRRREARRGDSHSHTR